MTKRYVAFILFGVAGINIITDILFYFFLFRLYKHLEIYSNPLMLIDVSAIINIVILVFAGVIVLIKSREPTIKKKFIESAFRPIKSDFSPIERESFIDQIQGRIHIESIQKVTKENRREIYLLKLILSNNSSSIMVNIEGENALKVLKLIKEGVYVKLTNVSVKLNSITNEKELYFTEDSSLQVI